MLERLIRFSLVHRWFVLLAAGIAVALGGLRIADMPVDVFPDLSAPTVTVITEAPGMAPEEVELFATFPLESALNGAPNIRRLRSVSAAGISVIWVEFEWGEDVYRARQVVTERLRRAELPAQVEEPQLGPISSIMGEITFIALTTRSASESATARSNGGAGLTGRSEGSVSQGEAVSQIELRRLADVVVKRRILAIAGISQVVPIGGEVRQFQIELEPGALAQNRVGTEDVVRTLAAASRSSAAGFHVDRGQEYLVRGLTRARTAEDLAAAVVRVDGGVPLRVGDLGRVSVGAAPRRGTASFSGRPAVVLSVQKQPGFNTLELTRELDRVLAELAASLPEGVVIETESFRQADFIETAVGNVSTALGHGAILVVVILLLFLGNFRATFISALALPLSLIAGVLVVSFTGGTLNTMTLGGLTIAVGALVDDAIIDVENVFRRLRENRRRPPGDRRPALDVVFRASSEVRKAIFFATLILVLVLLPLFFLPGVEGRLLRPLGLSYVAALAASLLVAVTVTPVLCLLLLNKDSVLDRRESPVLRACHRLYAPVLEWALGHRRAVVAAGVVALIAAAALLPFFGRSFLPPFNEGSLTVSAVAPPGIPLADGDALGRAVEETLLAFPEVVSISRRTGRAEKDEHVQGVNASEMEVVLRSIPPRSPLFQRGEGRRARDKDEMLAEMRHAVSTLPGVVVSFGQPISHRIDHHISGSRTNLAVKIFGRDPTVLRSLAGRVEEVLASVPGIVDLSNQEQASVPALLIEPDRERMARHGLSSAALATAVEALFQGAAAGEIVEDGLVSQVVVRFPERLRADRDRLAALPVTSPAGRLLRLDDVARVRFDLGPSLIRRENVERMAMITANVVGADLAGTVERARDAVGDAVELPPGYLVTFGGQFEEAVRSVRHLAILSVVIVIGMYALLFVAFGNRRDTLIVLVNLPLALIGGIVAVALSGGVLSVVTLVGFVTLFGIATRNGVLLVGHYQHLEQHEGLSRLEAVRQGSRERLAPILMTALTAGLALIPLVLAGHQSGNEIQSPMAQVILGGLLSSTFLNLVIVPALFASGVRRGGGSQGSRPGLT